MPSSARGNRCGVGLHVTLTAPFRPLTMHFRPADGGMFLSLPTMLQRGFVRRLDREIIQSEISAQFSAFGDLFGRAPDFADGHQHAQLFPVVRDAFLAAAAANAPGAWVRQGGSNRPLLKRLNSPKALLLDEPSTFLDLRHQLDLLALLQKLARERGLGVLMASHDLNLTATHADRAVVLHEGRVVADGAPAHVLQPDLLERVYGVKMRRIDLDGSVHLIAL